MPGRSRGRKGRLHGGRDNLPSASESERVLGEDDKGLRLLAEKVSAFACAAGDLHFTYELLYGRCFFADAGILSGPPALAGSYEDALRAYSDLLKRIYDAG